MVELSYDCWSAPFRSWLRQPTAAPMRRQIREYRALVGRLVDRPEAVELIMSLDLARTVDRLERREDSYVTNRGENGRVAGRTLALGDRVMIILDACNLFQDVVPENPRLLFNPVGGRLMTHIATHEAQHALIRQRGTHSYGEPPADSMVASFWFHHCATLLLDEYRAEAGAQLESLSTSAVVRAHNVIEALDVLGRHLQAAYASYQVHRDVRRVRNEVAAAAEAFWVVPIGYFLAGRRAGDANGSMPPDLVENPLWQRYVVSSARAIEATLRNAPDSRARADEVDPDLLPSLVSELAGLLAQSLREFGFDFQDADDGGFGFWIRKFEFPPTG